MTDNKVRLGVDIPEDVDAKIRLLRAEKKVPATVAVSVLLQYGLDRLDEPELKAELASAVTEHRELRAGIGRDAMKSRYADKGA